MQVCGYLLHSYDAPNGVAMLYFALLNAQLLLAVMISLVKPGLLVTTKKLLIPAC